MARKSKKQIKKMKRKITKTEKQGVIAILIGIVVFAFLTDPITNFVSNLFSSNISRFAVGMVILLGIAWWGRLNKIFR